MSFLRHNIGPTARYISEFGLLSTIASQGKLCVGLGEPHSWLLGPERRKHAATLEISVGIALFVMPEPFGSCCSRLVHGSPCKFCICIMYC